MSAAPRPGEKVRSSGAVRDRLETQLRGIGEVRMPDEAEEPILAPATRAAVFEWMAELRAIAELKAAGLKPRSSALLYGPPGTGKTTLAHHLAARLGIPMVLVGAEGIMAKYLGESEALLTRLFDALERAESPVLLFLDELDAIGGHRSRNSGGGADNARSSILTVLLRRIERFEGMCCAATNRQDHLDPALWRRFHLQVAVELPGDEERFAILRRYGLPWAWSDDALDLLTDATAGASPALLRGVMEGMKRARVLAPRIRREAEAPAHALRRVVAAAAPPPEIAPPPLWQPDGGVWAALEAMEWPVREDAR
jgi:ATP-dependent 26S proteasome regulatory subunit